MIQVPAFTLCGVALFGIGFVGVAGCRHLIRRVMALNVMGSGVFLTLVAMAQRTSGEAADPVPHAMVLTGVVVAVSATALALALVRRVYRETGRIELPRPGASSR